MSGLDEGLIKMIAEAYQLHIHSTEIYHDTTRTQVVKLVTNKGKFILKAIFSGLERLQFMLSVETYLQERGISIPRVIPTASGEWYVFWNGSPYTVQQFVKGKQVPLTSAERYEERGRLLGHFHARSLGCDVPLGGKYLGANRWEATYLDELESIDEWRYVNRHTRSKRRKLILSHIDFFLSAGSLAYERLQHDPYFTRWKSMPKEEQFLCHGDFHTSNVLWNEREGCYTIIDWEFTRYDFPSVDIGRLLYIITRNENRFDPNSYAALIKGYLQENPLNYDQSMLLYQDLVFPHILERFLRRKWYREMSLEDIEAFLLREREKTAYFLQLLRNEKRGFA